MKRLGIEVEIGLGLTLMLTIIVSIFYVLLTTPVSKGGFLLESNQTKKIEVPVGTL